MQSQTALIRGLKKSMPIALGYFPISFTFGIMATSQGIHPLIATIISLTNFTSAGQFAGTTLIIEGARLMEIAMTTFVINIRYMLMSFAITQKIKPMSLGKKMILAFGITDEVFVLASVEEQRVSFTYMLGMIVGPYVAWSLGTLFGAYASGLLGEHVQQAMGIALYAMFIALIVPGMKKSRAIAVVTLLTVANSYLINYLPCFYGLTDGWKIIMITVIGSLLGAWIFPLQEEAYT